MQNDRGPIGLLRYVMTVGLLALFASLWLTVWVIHQGSGQRRFWNLWAKGNRDYVVWAPLEHEKKLYTEAGYDIQWLDGEGFVVLRDWLGSALIKQPAAKQPFSKWRRCKGKRASRRSVGFAVLFLLRLALWKQSAFRGRHFHEG